eukprot:3918249-Ditylum_brightwellii.AAC.1
MDYCLYCNHKGQGWTACTSQLGNNAQPDTTFYLEGLSNPPPDKEQATVKVFRDTMIIFEGSSSAPQLQFFFSTVDPWDLELDTCSLLRHSIFPHSLILICLCSSWHLVSDGSFQLTLNCSQGTASAFGPVIYVQVLTL